MKAFHAVIPMAKAMSNAQNMSHQRWTEESRDRAGNFGGASVFFRQAAATMLMAARIVRVAMLVRVGVNPSMDRAIKIIPITPGPRHADNPKRSNLACFGVSQIAAP